jgi:hypothetical protein
MTRQTTRSSTIFIATGDETRVFRSVQEVPPELRRKLVESTRGMNSATILIADKKGREELVRALQGRRSEVQSRLVDTMRSKRPQPSTAPNKRTGIRSIRTWLEFLLPVIIGASLWFLIDSHV